MVCVNIYRMPVIVCWELTACCIVIVCWEMSSLLCCVVIVCRDLTACCVVIVCWELTACCVMFRPWRRGLWRPWGGGQLLPTASLWWVLSLPFFPSTPGWWAHIDLSPPLVSLAQFVPAHSRSPLPLSAHCNVGLPHSCVSSLFQTPPTSAGVHVASFICWYVLRLGGIHTSHLDNHTQATLGLKRCCFNFLGNVDFWKLTLLLLALKTTALQTSVSQFV